MKKKRKESRSTQRHTSIPPTLARTKAATLAAMLPDVANQGLPTPHGTAFLVSKDGYLLTARHVIADENGNLRPDIPQIYLMKELELGVPYGVDARKDLAICIRPFSKGDSNPPGCHEHSCA